MSVSKITPLFSRSYKKRLFICILIPVVITLLLYAAMNSYFLANLKREGLGKCQGTHTALTENCGQIFHNLYQTSILLMDNPDFRDLYYTVTTLDVTEYDRFVNAKTALTSFSTTKPYIYQIGFISEANDRYISSRCTEFLENYYNNPEFGSIINSTDYLEQYEKRGSILQIQPTDVMNGIPVVTLLQFTIGNYYLPNPLIYCIDQTALTSLLASYRHTSGSEVILYCPATDEIICSTRESLNESVMDCLTDLDITGEQQTFWNLKGTKYYCCISVSQSSYSDSLVYLSLVPYSDILSNTTIAWMFSLLTILLCGVIASGLGFYFSFRLYLPIQNMVDTIQTAPIEGLEKPSGDEILFLDKNVQKLLAQNRQLQINMNNALPLIYSRYILNLLYQKNYDNESLLPMLTDFESKFPYANFICAVLIPKFSTSYFRDFRDAERNLIMGRLTEILTLTQDGTYIKYAFQITKNEFCIITNFSHDNPKELLYQDFMALQQLFSFDKDYIQFYIAFGSSCSNINDISISWKNANQTMATLSVFQQENIRFFENIGAEVPNFVIGPDDDNYLTSALYRGDHDMMLDLLSRIVRANELLKVQDIGFKNLYVHLYELANSTAVRRELDSQKIMGTSYVSLSDFIHNLNNLQRSEYIRMFYENVCRCQEPVSESVFDLSEIKAYVDEHFCEDLYLELLADRFRTTPKYMSRLLKQALGVPFKQYISNLRVAKAMDMLINTDEKVEEIALACGFTNRYSFIRVFKQLQGLTPSEYRTFTGDGTEKINP